MRYGFINNFSQALAADLAAGATTMTLDGGGSLLSAASADLVYTLTLDDGEGTTEIVHVTAASGNDLTIERGKEGTSDAAWASGSTIEMRETAAALGSFVTGGVATGAQALAAGEEATASGDRSVAMGSYYAQADGYLSVALAGAWAQGDYSIGIGYCTAWGAETTVMGSESQGYSKSAVLGAYVYGQANAVTCLGAYTGAFGEAGIAAGHYATANADYAVAIGAGVQVSVPGGYRCGAVPYLATDPEEHYANAFPGHGAGDFTAAPITRRTSPYVVIATDPLDLTTGGSAVTLDLPAGTRLFLDSIDVVISGSSGASGSPGISVGPDDVTPAAYLAATPVAGTAVGSRQSETPLVADGVTSLRAVTTTAGAGTTYQAKIIFRGYVMEL